jgi:hypothetical protein
MVSGGSCCNNYTLRYKNSNSQCSSVGIVTRLRIGRLRNLCLILVRGKQFIYFSYRPEVRLNPHSVLLIGYQLLSLVL